MNSNEVFPTLITNVTNADKLTTNKYLTYKIILKLGFFIWKQDLITMKIIIRKKIIKPNLGNVPSYLQEAVLYHNEDRYLAVYQNQTALSKDLNLIYQIYSYHQSYNLSPFEFYCLN